METSLPNTTPTKVSALRDSNEAHPQKSTFIPPFIKNVKLESPNSMASSAFVPAFKKLRSSSKTEEEEHRHHFIAPFTNDCPAPSTKNPKDPAAEAVCMEDTLSRGKYAA